MIQVKRSWTASVCVPCWDETNPDRKSDPNSPYDQGPIERCYRCGQATRSGIYVRVDPDEQMFPRPESDDESFLDIDELANRIINRIIGRMV